MTTRWPATFRWARRRPICSERRTGAAEGAAARQMITRAPCGIITLSDVLSVPRDEWGRTSVQAAMRRAEQIYSVSPDAGLEDAMRLMDEKNVAQVPVMLDGRLLGIIGRDHLIRLILNRAALAKL